MEGSFMPTNNNIYPDQNNQTTQLYDSYIEFVQSSNASIRIALDIIYNQQISFNQFISSNRLHNINSATPEPVSAYQTNNYSTPISTQNRETFNQPLPNTYNFFPYGSNISHFLTEFPYISSTDISSTDISSTDISSTDIPSVAETESAIEYITFSVINNALNTTCPISHRDFLDTDTVIQLRECKHIFDASSILQWFTRNSLCPLCRNDIRSIPEIVPPIPFAQQLAELISTQISNDRDFSGNINIEIAIPPC
jgi:hypothetical protein